MTESSSTLAVVTGLLTQHQIGFALIGASALALHGVSRSTVDIDLLVSDGRALEPDVWSALPHGMEVDIRRGDVDDPLAGVVRVRVPDAREVDVIVGRATWQADVIARAEPAFYVGVSAPAARPEDLILLKLYAGGTQDRWDIEQLLARPDRDELVRRVEHHLELLPEPARQLWRTLLSG